MNYTAKKKTGTSKEAFGGLWFTHLLWTASGSVLRSRFWILLFGHALVFAACFVSAVALRFDFRIPSAEIDLLPSYLVWLVSVKLVCFYAFRSFHGWWRYVTFADLRALTKASLVSLATLALVDHFLLPFQFPRAVLLVDLLLSFVALGFIRSSWRMLSEVVRPMWFRSKSMKTLLIGSSDTTIRLGHQLQSHPELQYDVIGLVSRNSLEQREWISNFEVLGSIDAIRSILSRYDVDEILVPGNEITGAEMRRLSKDVEGCGKVLRVIPRVEDLLKGNKQIPIRNVEINDLLGREPVALDSTLLSSMIRNQTVLVTGAGGSIGSEICRQLLAFSPERLIALGRGENRIFNLERELRGRLGQTTFIPVIADVNDLCRLADVFETYHPDLVIHAAAHKHVPLMESNVAEAIRNNILGTRNVVDCAHEFGASRFVLISTDKAVNPTSVMGATKHLAERYALSRVEESNTRFFVVRFGNVLGSNGSVVPIFTEQIRNGGPITITDPKMTRFFMSIPEASQLVLQAASLGRGGEIFVLDMGEPVLITDLAKDLVRLSGLDQDAIDIEFTGVRPGEKLYEELYFDEETSLPTDHPKIFAAYHRPFFSSDVASCIGSFAEAIQANAAPRKLLSMLADAIPEFCHNSSGVRFDANIEQPNCDVKPNLQA